MTENYLQLEHTGASKEELDQLTFGALKKAVEGDIITGSMMSGQIAGMIHDIKTVNEVIEDLILQYETVKREK